MSRAIIINPMYWGGRLRYAYWPVMIAGQNRNCPKTFPKCQKSKLICISTETVMVEELVRVGSHPLNIGRKPKSNGEAGDFSNDHKQNKVNVYFLDISGKILKIFF